MDHNFGITGYGECNLTAKTTRLVFCCLVHWSGDDFTARCDHHRINRVLVFRDHMVQAINDKKELFEGLCEYDHC